MTLLTPEEKTKILLWLNTKYNKDSTMLDYCYEIYYEILDYCINHNMVIIPKNNVFFGHLISVIYKTYMLR